MKFKIGDRVKVIATQERLNYISAHGLKPNEEYIISDYDGFWNDSEEWFKLGDGLQSWCRQEDIELVRQTLRVELESKYAVGDKFKGNMFGDLYEVFEIKYDNGFYYRLSEDDAWDREWYLDNECTLYTEPEVLEVTMEDLEKKFGTKVKIVK